MSLLDQAKADLQTILTDNVGGFAVPITVTDPDGNTAIINGLQSDVHLSVDPQTGGMIAGRRASVALSLASLAAAGLGEPRGIAGSSAAKPWLIAFTTPTGKSLTMKVAEALPDELGCIVCLLEIYKS